MSEPTKQPRLGAGLYRWRFEGEDEMGEYICFSLDGMDFIGTRADADTEGKRRADEWERETGGLVLKLELERVNGQDTVYAAPVAVTGEQGVSRKG